jgi:hypothetical protein
MTALLEIITGKQEKGLVASAEGRLWHVNLSGVGFVRSVGGVHRS